MLALLLLSSALPAASYSGSAPCPAVFWSVVIVMRTLPAPRRPSGRRNVWLRASTPPMASGPLPGSAGSYASAVSSSVSPVVWLRTTMRSLQPAAVGAMPPFTSLHATVTNAPDSAAPDVTRRFCTTRSGADATTIRASLLASAESAGLFSRIPVPLSVTTMNSKSPLPTTPAGQASVNSRARRPPATRAPSTAGLCATVVAITVWPFVRLRTSSWSVQPVVTAASPAFTTFQRTVTSAPGTKPPAGVTESPATRRSGYGASATSRTSDALLFSSARPPAPSSVTTLLTSARTSKRRLPAPRLPAGSVSVAVRLRRSPGASGSSAMSPRSAYSTSTLPMISPRSVLRTSTRSSHGAFAGSLPRLTTSHEIVTWPPESSASPSGVMTRFSTWRSGPGTVPSPVMITRSVIGVGWTLKAYDAVPPT